MKLTIGATTYNDVELIAQWINSVKANLPQSLQAESKIVIVDDGTPDKDKVAQLQELCVVNEAELITHGYNKGIPTAWNTISRRYPETELICIFNNDILVRSVDTFPAAIYFMDNNVQVGASCWPADNIPGINHYQPAHFIGPEIIGSPLGSCFFFRREAYEKTTGFWEELISFYEEVDFGFQLYPQGYEVRGMPYPTVWHRGAATFLANPKLKEYKGEQRIDRARKMFAAKWGISEYVKEPQNVVDIRLVEPIRQTPKLVKWLDSTGLIEAEWLEYKAQHKGENS